jgi:Cytochrome c554 and c-prime
MLRSLTLVTLSVLALCGAVSMISGQDASHDQLSVEDASRIKYVGDAACISCHNKQSLSYARTAHHLTSQLPQAKTILGSFTEGRNVLMISNPETATVENPQLSFKMEAKNGGFYQTAIAESGAQHLTRSERIDIVVGSGVRGQTYLYWSSNALYELPVSYWHDGSQWINSPGYRDGTANFARHVDPRCMECHSTYIKALSTDPQTNLYDKATFVPGISCESCHGAGAEHAAREKSKPRSHDEAILNPANFSRDRKVDQCALCHNGTQRDELVPAFSYRPGEPLDKYLAPNPSDNVEHPDVHGNQVGLLKRSLCYRSSPEMSCSTCHDVHAPERTLAEYSARCLTCHKWQSCGAAKTRGIAIKQNCIDCHMPVEETKAIVSVTAGRVLHAAIRTHWIRTYPQAGVAP